MDEEEMVGIGGEISVIEKYGVYPEKKVRKEFKSIAKVALDPAVLLGVADGVDIAEILNLMEVQRLHYKTVPEIIKGDTYMAFDLFVAVSKPIVNVARNGRLLQAITKFRFEPDVPSWYLAWQLKQQQQEELKEAKEVVGEGVE